MNPTTRCPSCNAMSWEKKQDKHVCSYCGNDFYELKTKFTASEKTFTPNEIIDDLWIKACTPVIIRNPLSCGQILNYTPYDQSK